MKHYFPQLVTTLGLVWLCVCFAPPAWSNPRPPQLPALTQCLTARTVFPIGREFYHHFFVLADTTGDGLAEFCLSFVQDPRGTQHAADWLQRAAHKGLPDAQLLLASGHESGSRVEQDPSLAHYWYEQAAHHNFPHAQYELATIYYSGQRLGLPQDFDQAYFWNTLAQQWNFAPATELNEILVQLVSPEAQEAMQAHIREWNRTHVSSRP